MRFPLLLATIAASLSAAADDSEAAKKELKRFEGAWVPASGEKGGAKLADEDVKKGRITWTGKEVRLLTPHQSKEEIKGTVTLDPTTKPKRMDWVRSQGPHKGEAMQGIYEFVGEDSYRVCFAPPGKERPKEFRTKPGSGHTLHVWKRAKD
jgi:uncharacterized protein (TIGR03067 family)